MTSQIGLGTNCLVPAFDGVILSIEWRDALWAKFYTAAPHSLPSRRRGTEAIRRAIQNSQESLIWLVKRYGINPKTVAKWRKRTTVSDTRTGPTDPKSTVLTIEEEAIIVAFRKHTLLPLDDCLYTLQPTIPHLTREQLVKLVVENVPADQAEGQDLAAIAIPGVNAPDQKILEELAIPDTPNVFNIQPHGLTKLAAQAVVRRVILAQTEDVARLQKTLSSRYGNYMLANGEPISREKLVAQYAKFAKEWAYRSREIDQNSLNMACQDNDVACTVTGEVNDAYGVAEDGVVVKNRYRFSYTIMLPITLPAVTVEQIEKVN